MKGTRRFKEWGWIVLYVCLMAVSVGWVASQDREPIEEDQEEKITLTFRHFWNKEHDRQVLEIVSDVISRYQAEHPNIKINFEGMDQTIHREQKLKSEMVTGNPPDMFVLFGGAEIEPYVRSNRLMDLSDFIEMQGLKDQFTDLQLWTFDNRIYGLPMEGHAEPLYYNKVIFDRLGMAPPETLKQLDDVIDTLKTNGIIPFAVGNEDRWPAGIFAHYLMDRYAGPSLIQRLAQGDDDVRFHNTPYLEAFKHLQKWIAGEAFSPSSNQLSTEDAISLFTKGEAAMYLNGNWDINLFQSESDPHFQQKVGVIPFPSLNAGDEKSMAGGYTIGIGLSSELENSKKEAALGLMKALYTREVQERIVYEGLRIPSMKIPFDPERTGPVFAQVIELLEQSPNSFLPYDNVLSPEVKKSFLEVIEDMISGKTDAMTALRQIQQSSVTYWELRRNSGG
ncbi:ABC transporter substrate-binding protein [Paenibacillus lemnae]|uniref:Extracellular solute-binding protein n=1 Tax=Paenibacillus lemnae TaxID=1330551 RepID=A0A848MD84_PAELE|nr:extracellular solute-binding protein [Paenibacillus lemnae]NMO97394.1 extracellular solute-binding protein [Paenibacillus lemnae]